MTRRDYVLTALRSARLHAQRYVLEIDEIGIALKHNLIGPEAAIDWALQIGALEFVEGEPKPILAEVAA
jgi:hypothetical protein